MKSRLCLVVTSGLTVKVFLIDHLNSLVNDFDVTIVTSLHGESWLEELDPRVRAFDLPMERRPSPLRDLCTATRLLAFLETQEFDLVHSFTPKAGFLVALTCAVRGRRLKLHTFTGQVWATQRGIGRLVLKWMDRVIAMTSTAVITDSWSQREVLRAEGIAHEVETVVLGKGCFTGVSLRKFRPDPMERERGRRFLAAQSDDTIVLFVGRLKRDKGILDLARASALVADSGRKIHLVICGPDEEELRAAIEREAGRLGRRLHLVGFTDCPEAWMQAADVLSLPSYREGFGSVIVEAGAAGVPAIGSRIPGIVDAIDEGRTGLLHNPGDVADLTRCLELLVDDQELRKQLGRAAERRAREHFSREGSIADWKRYYKSQLG
jgi:glycosyltransferase involved in cell wall biosynthesis